MREFYMTRMGHKFYEVTLPRIAKALEEIADSIKKEPPAQFKCTCGYDGLELSGDFLKCMKCGRVYR